MSGHTPTPWWVSHATTVEGHPMVVAGHGHDHGLVAEVLTEEDAKHLTECVNGYASLVAQRDALRTVVLETDCPRPANSEPDGQSVKDCVALGCCYGAALSPSHVEGK